MSKREERLDDPEEAQRQAAEGLQARLWTALPAIVVDVDLERQVLSAQPTIQAVVTEPGGATRLLSLPVCPDCPIQWPRGGGFALTFPIKPGDECLLVFAARAIDSWWQQGSVAGPVEARMHDLSDGIAIVGITSQPRRLTAVSSVAVELRNDARTSLVSIDDAGKVSVVASVSVEIVSPLVKVTAATIDLNGIIWQTHVHGGVLSGVGSTAPPTP